MMSESKDMAKTNAINNSKSIARTVLESLIVMTVLVTCLILFIVVMAKRNLRKSMHLLMVANLAAAGIIFGLLVRPGSIHEEIRSYELGHGYCSLYLLLLKVEWIVVPYTLWMMSIERCIALNEPEKYAKRFSTSGRIALISFPWILGIVLGITINFVFGREILTRYASYRYDPYFDEYTHFQQVGCLVLYSGRLYMVAHILWIVLGTVIPLLGLIATSIALLIIFCRKRDQKTGSDEDGPQVQAASVVYSLILNMAFVFVLTQEFTLLQSGTLATFLYTHWFVCIGELMVAVLGLSLLSEIRQTLAGVCGCGTDSEEGRALLEIQNQESETRVDK